jgi:16S rRNA (uracil1498-N3)-methyltransferase
MKQIQHFFIDVDLSQERVTVRDHELLNQMKNVLRFRAGDKVVLLDNHGSSADATVELIHAKEAVLIIHQRETFEAPTRRLRLYVALPKKPATLEWIVEKATELGVTDIVPVDTQRCQVHELRKTERLRLIIREAAEQCERIFMPELHEVLSFADLMKDKPSGLLLAGDPWIFDKTLSDLELCGDLNIVIGPEGGLTDEELSAVRSAGGTLFQLGDLVLRMETAVIAALSVVQFG